MIVCFAFLPIILDTKVPGNEHAKTQGLLDAPKVGKLIDVKVSKYAYVVCAVFVLSIEDFLLILQKCLTRLFFSFPILQLHSRRQQVFGSLGCLLYGGNDSEPSSGQLERRLYASGGAVEVGLCMKVVSNMCARAQYASIVAIM